MSQTAWTGRPLPEGVPEALGVIDADLCWLGVEEPLCEVVGAGEPVADTVPVPDGVRLALGLPVCDTEVDWLAVALPEGEAEPLAVPLLLRVPLPLADDESLREGGREGVPVPLPLNVGGADGVPDPLGEAVAEPVPLPLCVLEPV